MRFEGVYLVPVKGDKRGAQIAQDYAAANCILRRHHLDPPRSLTYGRDLDRPRTDGVPQIATNPPSPHLSLSADRTSIADVQQTITEAKRLVKPHPQTQVVAVAWYS